MRILIALLVIVAGMAAVFAFQHMRSSAREANDQANKITSSFVPNPHNDNSVVVRGWAGAELERILGDFRQSYEIPQASGWSMTAGPGGELVIAFPNDIEPRLLFFLVNYIQYPKGFDLTQRTIAVLSHVVLTPAFGIPDNTLIGKHAVIYVPSNDTEYDLVCAKVENGGAYEIPFTNLIWKRASDPRMPNAVKSL
jgi:hypothetical protein